MSLRQRNGKSSKQRPSFSLERRLLFSVLATGLPCALLAFLLLWTESYSLDHKIEGSVLLISLWLLLALSVRNRIIHSVRVLSNVVAALQEKDFSFRVTRAVSGDALGDLAIEINNLARDLEAERLAAKEAENLLRKVVAEADDVILAFSTGGSLKLFNRAAASFLGKRESQLANRTAQELGIADLIQGPPSGTITRLVQGIERRWIVRRTQFRQSGIPHHLVMLSEASEALRAEERAAWQRLVRVLSHEINNSLAPIKSVSRTLGLILSKAELPPQLHRDFALGLDVIGTRTENLNRFLQSYARLNQLPPPTRRATSLKGLVDRVTSLEARLSIEVLGPEVTVKVDPGQIEQVLINLLKNAVEAVLVKQSAGNIPPQDSIGNAVTVNWKVSENDLRLWVRDEGIGLLDASNLFVPFYTTKETGTGIGLVLSRQIIEAHGGRIVIRNRADNRGCEVELKLPDCVQEPTGRRTALSKTP